MKIIATTIFSLFFFPFLLVSAPFDDSQAVREQYEEFRHQGGADRHQPVENDADMAELYLVYGQNALEDGDLSSALKHFRAGNDLAPEDGRFAMMMGMTYSRSGDVIMAENSFLEAVRQLPEKPEPLKLLADHYYRAGQLPEAENALQELIGIVPQDASVRKQLQQVQREIGVEEDMVQDVNSIFNVKFDERIHGGFADKVVDTLQEAYAEQGSLLNFYPQKTIQVILYTRDDYDMTTGAPPWSAGRFDGKIRLPVSTKHLERIDLSRILHHEYNHFIAQQLSRGRAPAWFYEGLAMVSENGSSRNLEHFTAMVSAGNLFSFAELEKSFSRLDTESAYLAYGQSYSFVNYLLQQFGWHTLRDLLESYGRGFDTEQAFASVFNDFGISYAQLLEEWFSSL